MDDVLGALIISFFRMAFWGLHVKTDGMSTKIYISVLLALLAWGVLYMVVDECIGYVKRQLGILPETEASALPPPEKPAVAARKAAAQLAGMIAKDKGGKLVERVRNKRK